MVSYKYVFHTFLIFITCKKYTILVHILHCFLNLHKTRKKQLLSIVYQVQNGAPIVKKLQKDYLFPCLACLQEIYKK